MSVFLSVSVTQKTEELDMSINGGLLKIIGRVPLHRYKVFLDGRQLRGRKGDGAILDAE